MTLNGEENIILSNRELMRLILAALGKFWKALKNRTGSFLVVM